MSNSENEDSENEDSECYQDSDDNEVDEIETKYHNHIEELKKIKIEGHCLLKNALVKYIMQTDTDSERKNILMKIILTSVKLIMVIIKEHMVIGDISDIVKRYLI